ncbi:unnamed protein product [Didymodactylos carnosus]|uniref:Geminivirus AL1 replication-associated protein central domain-containing protein n=1 Tax=Didymodactylos carnosus TaxID=1234261 RepID=A0A815Y9V7_9BILA|nr:unnamed protein product [Didymodactylos carnosus]CAF4430171.1 unnamed protein product [Didymodactylos carnosus]
MADDVKLRRAVTNSLVYQRQKRKQADEHSQTKQKNNLISKNGEQKIAPAESIDEQSEVEYETKMTTLHKTLLKLISISSVVLILFLFEQYLLIKHLLSLSFITSQTHFSTSPYPAPPVYQTTPLTQLNNSSFFHTAAPRNTTYTMEPHNIIASSVNPSFSPLALPSSTPNTSYCFTVFPSPNAQSLLSPTGMGPIRRRKNNNTSNNTNAALPYKRFSKHHFQLKDILDSKNYDEIYQQIFNRYSNNIKYLCVALTSASRRLISIHLMFKIRPNYTRLFLNDIITNATRANYEDVLDDDEFNESIKLNNSNYIESNTYTSTKTKTNSSNNNNSKSKNHFKQRNDNAALALQQLTVTEGMKILRTTMPYDYVIHSTAMRNTLDKTIGEQERIEKLLQYQPQYPITSFSVPPSHIEKINNWLANDFHERIHDRNPTRTRSNCLFIIGETKSGTIELLDILIHFLGSNLAEWCDRADYVVFDDIPWADIKKQSKQLLTAPGEVQVTDKYLRKEKIRNNKPCIYLLNFEDIGDLMKLKYWQNNGVFVLLDENEKLFV